MRIQSTALSSPSSVLNIHLLTPSNASEELRSMDIISQLQEQVNLLASLTFNTFGTLQRDAPAARLSPNYPEPPPASNPAEDSTASFADQTKTMAATIVKAAKQFEALVSSLPISEGGEEAQIKKIEELQVENDAIGDEIQQQLEAAEKELRIVQSLFDDSVDNLLNMKKPFV